MGRSNGIGRVLLFAWVVGAGWSLAAPRTASAWCETNGTPGECRCKARAEGAERFSGVHAATGRSVNRPAALSQVTAAAGAVHIVHVYDTDFSTTPAGQPVMDPVIQVGDTVRWVFDSGIHTATSTAGSGETFDSGTRFQGDQPYEHTFTTVGTFEYYCQLHGADLGALGVLGMAGTVTVVVPEPRTAWATLLTANVVLRTLGRRGRRLCVA